MKFISFVVKSGRAVLYPVYKSTYERGDDYKNVGSGNSAPPFPEILTT